jgi:hypothetical protein
VIDMKKRSIQLTPHAGIADSCAAQGFPVIQLGGEVIVPGAVLIVVFGDTDTEDEEILDVEFEL